MNYIEQYWEKISNGTIKACRKLRRQMEKLIELLEKCKNKDYEYKFNEKLGTLPIIFIEKICKHSKGKHCGQPFLLELWEKAIIQATFGFVHRKTGFRKFNELLVVIARKNGKTTLAAALALYMFLGDGEGGAQIYCCATKKDQAKLLFKEAVNMINQSPALQKLVKKTRQTLETREATKLFASFEPLATDSNTLDGLNVHLGILDEIHAYKNREIYDVIKQGTSAREQPLIIMITTSGSVREGIYDEQYDYATKVINGLIKDEVYLAFIYEQDNIDEINDPSMFEKSNPNLGVTKNVDYILKQIQQGKEKKGYMATVLTKDFNIPTSSAESWLDLKYLKFQDTYNIDELRDNYCVGGVDLSHTTDLTCATILLIKKDNPEIKYVIQKYWMPYEKFEEKKATDKVPYDLWVSEHWIDLCEGNIVKFSDCTQWFVYMLNELKLYPTWIGYDNWSSGYWIQDMEKNGFGDKTLETVIQGPKSFHYPMDVLKTDLESGKINYNNNPVLRWCLSNVVVKKDAGGNQGPDKAKAKNRIDGAVSLLDAYAVLINHYEDYCNYQGI